MAPSDRHTSTLTAHDDLAPAVRKFRLTVQEGPAKGIAWESRGAQCSIGSQPGNDLVLSDPTVSRFHSEITVEDGRARVRDLASKNGTLVDGVAIVDAYLRPDATLRLGSSLLRFELGEARNTVPISERTSFGRMVGASTAMRAAFARLEKAAASDATVLLDGETGTGKGEAAESIHLESRRKGGPFVVLDCGAIPENLLETELFGHEKGAFTGATQRRVGVFEEADAGTVFLDEVGELPAALQPKLLRVLETRTLRRVGGSEPIKTDVRIVAATNRDLRAEVNAGRFRADLYYRLAVVRVTLPPLRQRPEDLAPLARTMLRRLGADDAQLARFASPTVTAELAHGTWPGNVRELRNYLERCLAFDDVLPPDEESLDSAHLSAPPAPARIDASRPFTEARDGALAAFERTYLEELLRLHGGRMTAAAAGAGIGRVYLYKLLVRHGLGKKR